MNKQKKRRHTQVHTKKLEKNNDITTHKGKLVNNNKIL